LKSKFASLEGDIGEDPTPETVRANVNI